MINYKETSIKNIIVHKVGNNKELSKLSSNELNFEADEHLILKNFLLKSFSTQVETFNFTHPVDVKLNPILACCADIFRNKNFIEASVKISNYLVESSRHPNIKLGELFVTKFDEILLDDNFYQAITIVKTENRESYFEEGKQNTSFVLNIKKGISTTKFDKGCLVINTGEENGYLLFIVDNNSNDTEYWKNIFLNVQPRTDSYFLTNNFLKLAKQFITSALPILENSKSEQVDLLNKSVAYFRENESFNIKDFQSIVFDDERTIKSFQDFGVLYSEQKSVNISETFQISNTAVKKQLNAFKSILKLDKNFHIYIHGGTDLIEKGYDDKKKMNYYKVYFKEELS